MCLYTGAVLIFGQVWNAHHLCKNNAVWGEDTPHYLIWEPQNYEPTL